MSKVLWEPTYERKKKTAMYRFMKQQGFKNYDDLYQWSINKRSLFWEELAKFCEVRFLKKQNSKIYIIFCLIMFIAIIIILNIELQFDENAHP